MLRLRFERRDGRTVLAARRFRLPLQALAPMDLDAGRAAVVMVLNPTGGLLAGDVLDTAVDLAPDSHVCVSAPSATRVYRSGGEPAIQRFAATVGAGATLEYLPDRLIPSPGARLRQSTDVTLGAGATLLLADSWACGRIARGERWGFDLLDSALVVRDERGLLLRERSVLEHGGWAALGGTEGHPYVGTFLAVRSGDADWSALSARVAADVERRGADSRGAVTLLARGGVLARLLCASAPALDAVCQSIWSICRRELLGLGPLHLRKL